MTVPGARSVSYLPGRWTAIVTDALCLLGDVPLADPLLAACWDAAGASGGDPATAVLDVLARAGRAQPPSFVLVARVGDAVRLVVAGRAHAEVFAGQQDPVVHRAADERSWLDERIDTGLDVRLVADDPTPFERIPPLPLTSGIVLASYVFSTAADVAAPQAAVDPAPAGSADEAVGWIPPPLAHPSQEYPTGAGWPAEPAPQLSGVFRALPWRSSLVDPDGAPRPMAEDVPPTAPDDGPVEGDTDDAPQPERPAQPSSEPQDKPSFGAPGYVAPPFGAEAFEQDYVYPPPPPPSAFRSPAPAVFVAPLVQAVRCANDHLNPLHIDACRMCGAGFAPQQPRTVERPALGVLHLPSGETVALDRDALLGRAPFAVDEHSVRLVEVASPENDISRSHVRITLDGWQVFATDLGSTNGTAVTLPGQPPALLRPHDPFALTPGSVLSLADEADVGFDVS